MKSDRQFSDAGHRSSLPKESVCEPILPDMNEGTEPSIGAVARTGMTWMTAAALLTKVASVAAQLVLARLLLPSNFGLYAAALGVAGLVTAFRDAGVTTYLVRYGVRDYARIAAPVFWLAMAVNVAGGLVLVAIGLVLGTMSKPGAESPLLSPDFPALLYVIALSMPLGTPGAILRTRMRLDLRFRELGVMSFVVAIIRYVGSTVLALAGAGAQSFVLPLLAIAIVEWVWGQAATRDRACWGRPAFDRWPEIIRETKWLLLGTLGGVIYNMGSYFCIALFVGSTAVGVFFFAYQLTQQVCALITTNLQYVLAPVLVHINDQSERLKNAALRTLRVLMLFAVPLMLGMTVTIDPVERLVLGGKWRDAVVPIMIFGALTPLALTWGLTYAILTSKSRFQAWAWASLAEGVFLTLAAAAAAAIDGSVLAISIATAVSMLVSRLLITLYCMNLLGVRTRTVLRTIAGAWLIGLVVAPAAIFIASRMAGASAAVEIVLSGGLFLALFGLGCRITMPRTIADAMSVMPGRARGFVLRVMLLRPAAAAR
jgi:PST family polysaccharide transporter